MVTIPDKFLIAYNEVNQYDYLKPFLNILF